MWIRSPRSSTERRSASSLLAAALAAALCLAPAALRAQEQAPDEIRQKVKSVLDRTYQQTLPGAEKGSGGGADRGPDSRPSSPPGEGRPRAGIAAPAAGALSWLSLVLLGVLAVVAVCLLVIWMVQNVPSARAKARRPKPDAEPGAPAPREEPARETGPSPSEAERLAAEGRWAEAVHALLLIAVRRLCARFSVPHASSRTSRELCRALPLQGEAREAFAGLVRTVEVSLFGGLPLGPDDYRASLERFRLLEGPR